MPLTDETTDSLSDQFLRMLEKFDRVIVVMHDNPDPDAIASGWGIKVMLHETLGIPTRVVGGGAIVRAENSHMVDLLNPPIELVDDLEVDDRTATVLVDCGVAATNHILTRQQIAPVAIIDHHKNNESHRDVGFVDIRNDVAASASIVSSYLQEQGIDPGPKLATAMLYAIQTETCAYETHYSVLDREVLAWLMEFGEPAVLAEIGSAPLRESYYGDLLLALQSTFLYDDVALCFLPRADGAEIVGEIADLLVRCESVHRVLCGAVVNGDMILSARTQYAEHDATELIQQAVDGLGGAGGHSHRAGGKIPRVGDSATAIEQLCEQLRSRWLAACQVKKKRGVRLVAKREIIQHLNR